MATRHDQLLGMVAEGVFQYSKQVLRQMAKELYQRAHPACEATLDKHLAEFEAQYEGAWSKFVLPALSPEERAALDSLALQSQRDIFVVVQNFAHYRRGPFYFSLKRVAERVGLTWQRVAQVKNVFEQRGFIEKLPGTFVPGVRALSYQWCLPLRPDESAVR